MCGQFGRQCKRKKGRLRTSSHRCQVAETARQATMANALRRMPIASKVDIFEREVRRNDQLFSAPRPYHGAIVADTKIQNSAGRQLSGALADGFDQFTFAGYLKSPYLGLGWHGASIPCRSADYPYGELVIPLPRLTL